MARDILQAGVNRQFRFWANEIEALFDRKCHDQIDERDKIDRRLILSFVLRWVLEDLSNHNRPEQMEQVFADIYCQLASQHLCRPKFEKAFGGYMREYGLL